MTTIQTIRKFLALPKTNLPSAAWVDSMGDSGSAWDHLRDYIRPVECQELNHLGETVRLCADCCEGWDKGIIITLE